MKIIIDIPEDMYKDANILIVKDLPELKKIIANGIPVPTEGDLISREALKKGYALLMRREHDPYDTVKVCDIVNQTLDFIDNAPNNVFVSSPPELIKVGEPISNSDEINEALEKGKLYKQGFEDAMRRFKRPQGVWIHRRIIAKDRSFDMVVCSNCQSEFSWDAETGVSMDNYKTCPNCTADMRKGGTKE